MWNSNRQRKCGIATGKGNVENQQAKGAERGKLRGPDMEKGGLKGGKLKGPVIEGVVLKREAEGTGHGEGRAKRGGDSGDQSWKREGPKDQ